MNETYAIAKEVEAIVKPQVERIKIAGSIRRGRKEPGDIDFVVIPKTTLGDIVIPNVDHYNWTGDYKSQAVYKNVKIDFLATTERSWGAALMHFTGPQWFNIKTRSRAKKMGLKLNEYGLWKGETKLAGMTEKFIFYLLDMEPIKPERR